MIAPITMAAMTMISQIDKCMHLPGAVKKSYPSQVRIAWRVIPTSMRAAVAGRV